MRFGRSYLRIVSSHNRGEHFCLEGFERLTIGRAQSSEIVSSNNRTSRTHAILTRLPDGEWELADSGSTGGTLLSRGDGWEKVSRVVLAPGDRFGWAADVYHYLHEPRDERWEACAAQLSGSDGSDGAWRVFTDQLEELGDPFVAHMLEAGSEPVLPLGFLRRLRDDGTLTFRCHYGFIEALTVTNVGLAPQLGQRLFSVVLAHPLVQFVRSLEAERFSAPGLVEFIRHAAPASCALRINGALIAR